jgi:hypothetical protein
MLPHLFYACVRWATFGRWPFYRVWICPLCGSADYRLCWSQRRADVFERIIALLHVCD